jgi:hypothetical protein
MDVEVAARRWAEVLRAAWPAGEVGAFAALYADTARFRQPFRDPEPAAEHMRKALSLGAPRPEVWVGEPLVGGDCAAVEWWAVIVIDGEPRAFAATAWLRFDADGRVTEEHDYVQASPERTEPWPGWAVRGVSR